MWELSWCCGRIARDSVQLRSEPHPQCDSTSDTLSQHTHQGAIHIAFSFTFGLQTADFHSPSDLLWRFDLQEMFVCTVVGFNIEFFLHQDVIFMDATLGCWMVSLLLTDNRGVCGWDWLRQLQVKLVFGKCWCKWICRFPLCKRGPHLLTYSKLCVKKGFKLADLWLRS